MTERAGKFDSPEWRKAVHKAITTAQAIVSIVLCVTCSLAACSSVQDPAVLEIQTTGYVLDGVRYDSAAKLQEVLCARGIKKARLLPDQAAPHQVVNGAMEATQKCGVSIDLDGSAMK